MYVEGTATRKVVTTSGMGFLFFHYQTVMLFNFFLVFSIFIAHNSINITIKRLV